MSHGSKLQHGVYILPNLYTSRIYDPDGEFTFALGITHVGWKMHFLNNRQDNHLWIDQRILLPIVLLHGTCHHHAGFCLSENLLLNGFVFSYQFRTPKHHLLFRNDSMKINNALPGVQPRHNELGKVNGMYIYSIHRFINTVQDPLVVGTAW
ncbi:hypothetical protein A9976_13345 [Delftia sp. UME58]|nr:hypothetical protein [Delftia sp. UME58]